MQVEKPLEQSLCRRGELFAGNYLVGDVLGLGGMGVVYAAMQRSLDRPVALKVPRPELIADRVVRKRLRCEALAGSRLSHRNIVRVLDYGNERGVPFVVMEHVAGPRLAQLLVELGPLPLATAISLARQIVAGLEDAHAHGVVHADVKADNILIETTRGDVLVPRLIDFGIARFIGDAAHFEYADPMVTGTPEYLPPEVIHGDQPTFAADVYAVGVLLYELVTGATPFTGTTSAEVLCRRLEDDVLPIRVRYPDLGVPAPFDLLVMKALSRDPAQRFADARALGRALDLVADAVAAGPPPQRRIKTTAPIFSAEATTATLSLERARTERTSSPEGGAQPELLRAALSAAIERHDSDAIVVACLDLARSLVDEHRLAAAISELEAGARVLARKGNTGPVWRLQLTLAALYDGVGDRARARLVAHEARESAARCNSPTGCARADQLIARLARRRSCTRRPRLW